MKMSALRTGFLAMFLWTVYASAFAATITQPILMEQNFPNATICQKSSFRVKFDHAGFIFDNVFTVEMAENGDFSNPASVYTMVGSLAQAGSAPNAIVSVTFPANVPAGNNYRFRMKGSSPLTYSSGLNQFPVAISTPPPFDTLTFPTGYWKGNFYRWTPTTPDVIADGNTQDIFNADNYLGYITEDTLAFDFNWGNGGPVPGILPDTNKVCGTMSDFFSIRMMRRINFEAGYYVFGGGADDGFRLSIDGGATWLIDFWSDHQMLGKMHNDGCGVFIPAGPRNVVAEYYENRTDSRFSVIIKRTGDPAANPLKITSPAEGATICVSSAPFQLQSNAQGGFQWSGPGVSANGMFNPAAAGLGFKTLNYETGFAAFGSNCLKATSITIQIVPGASAEFTGLDSAYCQSSDTIKLIPKTSGGSFFGPGVSGSSFVASVLNAGSYKIGYALDPGLGCGGDSVTKSVEIKQSPDASFTGLPDSVFKDSENIVLQPQTAGGVFAGEGVISVSKQWIPSVLPAGEYPISYTVSQDGCTAIYSWTVRLLDYVKPELVIPNLITANGDALNADWRVEGLDAGARVQIFDRWGSEVYKGTATGEQVWTGNGAGKGGLFFYVLEHPTNGRTWTGWLQMVSE
mgnify:FL=1